MKRLIISGYEAYTNSDLTEGRGRDVHIGYFVHESDARKAVKKKGVMGTDADTRKVDKEILLFETYEEFETIKTNDLRKKALNKLSYDEKKALGLI